MCLTKMPSGRLETLLATSCNATTGAFLLKTVRNRHVIICVRCDAEDCQCPDGMTHPEGKHFPDGRKYDEEDTEWEIMLCVCCGHQVGHEFVAQGSLTKTFIIPRESM